MVQHTERIQQINEEIRVLKDERKALLMDNYVQVADGLEGLAQHVEEPHATNIRVTKAKLLGENDPKIDELDEDEKEKDK